MKILIRSGALRHDTDSSAVVVGGPDTTGRETWLWDLSVQHPTAEVPADGSGCLSVVGIAGADDLRLRFDEREVGARFSPMTISGDETYALTRCEEELVVIVHQSGRIKDGSRVLDPGDVLVVEGADPTSLDLVPAECQPAVVSVGRLQRRDGRTLRWMP